MYFLLFTMKWKIREDIDGLGTYGMYVLLLSFCALDRNKMHKGNIIIGGRLGNDENSVTTQAAKKEIDWISKMCLSPIRNSSSW